MITKSPRLTLLLLISVLYAPRANAQSGRYTARHAATLHQILDLEDKRIGDNALAARYDSIHRFIDHLIDRALSTISYRPADNSTPTATKALRQVHELLVSEGVIFNRPGMLFHHSLAALPSSHPIVYNHINNMRPGQRRHALRHPPSAHYQADCDISVLLYLAVAESLQMPVSAGWLPTHMTLRWKLPDGRQLHIETQRCYVGGNDDAYRTQYRISPEDETMYQYLKPLYPAELKALYLLLFGIDQKLYPPISDSLRFQYLDEARQLRPQWPYLEIARLVYQLESQDSTQYAPAAALAAQLVQSAPGFLPYFKIHALAACKTGTAGQVLPALEKAVEANPGDAELQYLLGLACLRSGQPGRTCALYANALALDRRQLREKELTEYLSKHCGATAR